MSVEDSESRRFGLLMATSPFRCHRSNSSPYKQSVGHAQQRHYAYPYGSTLEGTQRHQCFNRITEILSRIKYGNRSIFYCMIFSVVDHFLQQKTPDFSETKLIWVYRIGVGVRVGE